MQRIEYPRHKNSVRLFDEVGGQPLNWGFTICFIVFICVANVLILIGLRMMLELKDEYDQPILKDYQQEILLQILGVFALSFGFGCCCCFCCGGRLPYWIYRRIAKFFSFLRGAVHDNRKHTTLRNSITVSPVRPKKIRPFVIDMKSNQNTVSTNSPRSCQSPRTSESDEHTFPKKQLPKSSLNKVASPQIEGRTSIINYFGNRSAHKISELTPSKLSTEARKDFMKSDDKDIDIENGESGGQGNQQIPKFSLVSISNSLHQIQQEDSEPHLDCHRKNGVSNTVVKERPVFFTGEVPRHMSLPTSTRDFHIV
ncbi:unnamed protein product [Bursaphelenchus okinawaensis]|uniref:Uncharacterized protein n=1 Tax=Bursaphelenchus okinawaensis TaxID=465554 RepID=A0A811LKW4_9BILA|nr:unnamed protein product [Bursaphelenchus okinawaensis]CAG9123585.1 unnamed protein product [Bursaphelenchus okinawaensis]